MATKKMTENDKFDFGKYKGETVRFVLGNDPGYILWLDEENIIKFSDEIIEKARQNDFDDDYSDFDHNYSSYYDD